MSAEKTKKPKQPAEPKKRTAAKPAEESKAVKKPAAKPKAESGSAQKKPTKAETAKKPDSKAAEKPQSKAAPKAEAKPKAAKTQQKADSKSAAKPSEKPKTDSKPEAKASAKKPAAKKSSKKADKVGGEASSKTPQVMRLVEQRNDMVNPTILAGKSSIPRKLRGLEPLTKIMKRDAETVFGTDEEAETFNLTALVIDDHAAQILRRFNACDCEVCIERLSQLTADSVPARFVKLKKRSVERKAAEVEELKSPLRRAVTSRMIRLVMQNKKRSFHDI